MSRNIISHTCRYTVSLPIMLIDYLRHSCNPDYMNSEGSVYLLQACEDLQVSLPTLYNLIDDYNTGKSQHQRISIDDDGDGFITIKSNSCHSIRHVYPMNEYIPQNEYSMGYIYLKYKNKYKPGDVFPQDGRNDVIVKFHRFSRSLRSRSSGHYLLVDLSSLYKDGIKLYNIDDTGVCVRGILPKEYFIYIPQRRIRNTLNLA